MKKKLRADSVDELFEIVKAVQNGEDPEEYAKRKRQEAIEAAEAAKRKRQEEREAEREAEEAAKRKREEERERAAKQKREEEPERAARSDDSEEEFEQLLEDGSEEEFDGLKAAVQGLRESLTTAGGFLGEKGQAAKEALTGWKESASRKLSQVRETGDESPAADQIVHEKNAEHLEDSVGTPLLSDVRTDEDRTRELGRVHLTDIAKEPVGKTRRRYGAKSISEESETIGQRILHSLHMDSTAETSSHQEPAENSEKPIAGDKHMSVGNVSDQQQKDPDEIDAESIDLDTVQILDRLLDVTEADSTETPGQPETGNADNAETPGQPETDSAETPGQPETGLSFWRKTVSSVKAALHTSHGTKKQITIIGSAAAAVILIVAAASCMIIRSSQLQAKRKYVTADEGLTITVENQPTEWCTSCELKMKISVKGGTISSIEIDGVLLEPDNEGYVTANAQNTPLEVAVTTENTTLSASVEIPMLDTETPVVTADITGGEIVLSATDTRSGVAQIRYAIVEDDDWLQLPQYQDYSEPVVYEEDCMYYFYAVDQAGNCSEPVVSTMAAVESITLSESELTLYPEGTAQIDATVNPSGALLTDLHYESSNTDVATVSSSGMITALAEGSALIKVIADGVDMASCSVTVVTEAVVTISAIGDCTLGTYKGSVTSTSFDTYYSMYGATWFFQNVKDILSNDDATFANLEGPLTNATDAADKTYAFKGDPSYTEILQDGSIEVVTLANNHSSDYGTQGLADTKENLTEAGIDYCMGDTIAYQEISGVKTAFIGIYELSTGLECESQVRETIAEAQSEGAQLIIVAFHWGSEKENYADEIQQSLAHTAIDCGADLVVGHHPHVLQGIEKYNGKYIVYSLGNFCFGGNSNPSDKDTMIFRQTFTVTASGVEQDDDIEIIPCTLSSESSYNDYRPTPVTGTAADEIMERINEYSAEFGDITYTASTGLL